MYKTVFVDWNPYYKFTFNNRLLGYIPAGYSSTKNPSHEKNDTADALTYIATIVYSCKTKKEQSHYLRCVFADIPGPSGWTRSSFKKFLNRLRKTSKDFKDLSERPLSCKKVD